MSHSLPEPIFQLYLTSAGPVGMIAASESFQAGSDRWNFVVFETRYSFLFWIPPINMRMLHYCWLFPKLLDILQHYRFSHINVVSLHCWTHIDFWPLCGLVIPVYKILGLKWICLRISLKYFTIYLSLMVIYIYDV